MNKIEIRAAIHGWIVDYWRGTVRVEEVYVLYPELLTRLEDLVTEVVVC